MSNANRVQTSVCAAAVGGLACLLHLHHNLPGVVAEVEAARQAQGDVGEAPLALAVDGDGTALVVVFAELAALAPVVVAVEDGELAVGVVALRFAVGG